MPAKTRHVFKIEDLKYFECPASLITRSTWQILGLVNEIADEKGTLLHLPYPGTILEQPGWVIEAARIVRGERNSDWYRRECEDAAKRKAGRNGR